MSRTVSWRRQQTWTCAGLVPAVAVEEGLQRAPQFGRQFLVPDRPQQRDGRFIGLELRDAAGTRRQVTLERGVNTWRQLVLDEIGEQPHQLPALLHCGLEVIPDPHREPGLAEPLAAARAVVDALE